MRVLAVIHGPSVPRRVFGDAVEERGHTLERWQVPDGRLARPGRGTTTR